MTPGIKGTTAIVTGGADGIGLAIAKKFADSGGSVAVCDHNTDAVERVSREYPVLMARRADVSNVKEVSAFIQEALLCSQGPVVLVNNVGLSGPHADIENVTVEEWDRVVRTNVSGMFYAAKEAIPLMKERQSGSLINISSVNSQTLPAGRAVYNMSKIAVEGLTRSLARELGPFQIRCNAILPGVMNNARSNRVMRAKAEAEGRTYEEIREEWISCNAMHKMIDEDDIANMAVFLASDLARYVTGQVISVCAGMMYEI